MSLPVVYLPPAPPTAQVVAGSAKEKVTGTAEPGTVSVDRDPAPHEEGKPGGRGQAAQIL